MCLAIPYGRRGSSGGTRWGRWLRERPARMTRLAGVVALALAALPVAVSAGPSWSWSALLLTQGLTALALAALLERLPAHCRVSGPGYLGHLAIALALGVGAALVAADPWWGGAPLVAGGAGGWGALAGALSLLLGWRLAAGTLRWQLAWCRIPVGAATRGPDGGPRGRLARGVGWGLGMGLGGGGLLAAGAALGSGTSALAGGTLALLSLYFLAGAAAGARAPGHSDA